MKRHSPAPEFCSSRTRHRNAVLTLKHIIRNTNFNIPKFYDPALMSFVRISEQTVITSCTLLTDGFYNQDQVGLLRGTN